MVFQGPGNPAGQRKEELLGLPDADSPFQSVWINNPSAGESY